MKWILLASAIAMGQPITGTDLVGGKPVTIDFSKQKLATAIVFLSEKCPCSRSHEEGLRKLAADFPDVTFVAVNSNANETPNEVATHFRGAKIPFPVLKDRNFSMADRFNAFKTPHVFVVDRSGQVLFQGGIDDSHDAKKATKPYLRNALTQIRNGKKPDPDQVRTLGCVIQRTKTFQEEKPCDMSHCSGD